MPYTYEYPRPAVSVDLVLFSQSSEDRQVLLIQRRDDPYAHHWAFPGGFMEIDETTEEAAHRELKEETGLVGPRLGLVGVFSRVDRDPRGRVLTVAFSGTLDPAAQILQPGDDARQARWFPLGHLPPLAFDHEEILQVALRARSSPVE